MSGRRGGRKSQSASGWERLRRVCGALRETEASVAELRSEAEERAERGTVIGQRLGQAETAKVWLGVLEAELEANRRSLLAGKGGLTKLRIELDQRRLDLRTLAEELEAARETLEERRSAYIGRREALLRSNALLAARRRQLAEELADIFVISSTEAKPPPPSSAKGGRRSEGVCACARVERILGAHIPAAESYAGHSEAELSVGLGRVASAVEGLAQLLDIPLRFPLNLVGSASTVENQITSGFTAEDRILPLYGKGQDESSFSYAVYLLNRDIGQLRLDLGLPTRDLRQTLPNLAGLFAHIRALKLAMPLSSSERPSPLPSSSGGDADELASQPPPPSSARVANGHATVASSQPSSSTAS